MTIIFTTEENVDYTYTEDISLTKEQILNLQNSSDFIPLCRIPRFGTYPKRLSGYLLDDKTKTFRKIFYKTKK